MKFNYNILSFGSQVIFTKTSELLSTTRVPMALRAVQRFVTVFLSPASTPIAARSGARHDAQWSKAGERKRSPAKAAEKRICGDCDEEGWTSSRHHSASTFGCYCQ